MNPNYDSEIEYAVNHTQLVRPPEQRLNTFGVTNIHYYLLTEPMDSVNETRIREGRVVAEKPKIVTPDYLLNTFEGFGEHARKQAEELITRYGFDPDIMEYRYKNNIGNSWILSENIGQVILKMNAKVDDEKDSMAAILRGPDDIWQVSLMMFITDMTRSSLTKNITELNSRGLFERQFGVPKFVRDEIEGLFRDVEENRRGVDDLGSKLRSYGLFERYQDRFFGLLRRRQ
ncbi:MAG: hypothetical protein WC749_06285 [Dehalococcoidia bacterium]